MSIQWKSYDSFNWEKSQQQPMTQIEKDIVSDFVADILKLSSKDYQQIWGEASPPGRYASTVIHLFPQVSNCYQNQAHSLGVREIGVKVFKTTKDAQREAKRIVPFHREYIHQLPGLPNTHIQKSVDAGIKQDQQKQERAFVIQEWVNGDSLEYLLRQTWNRQRIDGNVVKSIVNQLLVNIIIPLWRKGTIWWDIRDANYCYDESSGKLKLIDSDSLGAYVSEILPTPNIWLKRDKGRKTAIARLRQMTLRILLAQGIGNKRKLQMICAEAWANELEPVLCQLGKQEQEDVEVLSSLQRFFQFLEKENCLVYY